MIPYLNALQHFSSTRATKTPSDITEAYFWICCYRQQVKNQKIHVVLEREREDCVGVFFFPFFLERSIYLFKELFESLKLFMLHYQENNNDFMELLFFEASKYYPGNCKSESTSVF